MTTSSKPRSTPSKQMRRAVRFKPDLGVYAQLEVGSNLGSARDFQPTVVALVTEESTKGCSIVIIESSELRTGDRCRIQVGRLAPLLAEVRWRTDLDPVVSRLGLMYLE